MFHKTGAGNDAGVVPGHFEEKLDLGSEANPIFPAGFRTEKVASKNGDTKINGYVRIYSILLSHPNEHLPVAVENQDLFK